MQWQDYQDEFASRAGMMQIIIPDVCQTEWIKLVNFLRKTEVSLHFTVDGEMTELLPEITDILQDDTHKYQLSLVLDGVTLKCDLDRVDAMVFRFDATNIRDETKALLLFRVMSTFARRLRKIALLTGSNEEASPIFRYEHGQGLIYLKLGKKLVIYE